jgi:DNA-binding beta-propeller fold protein YncE
MHRILSAGAALCLAAGLACPDELAVITTTDYSSGNLAAIPDGEATAQTGLLPIHGDNWVVSWRGYAYVLERAGRDNVIRLSRDDLSSPLYQKSVGAGANPFDVALVHHHKAYVSRYDMTSLLVMDPDTGDSSGSVDLSAWVAYAGTDSAASVPNMTYMAVSLGRLYVACQRLKDWNPADTSLVVVIDTSTDAVLGTIPLHGKNPCAVSLVGTDLYVACTGSWWDATDGGIEVIDTASDRNLGVLLDETALGGNVAWVTVPLAEKGYALVMGEWPATHVKPFGTNDGSVGDELPGAATAVHATASLSGRLYVADRDDAAPGVFIYDLATDALIAGPVPTGLPPACTAVAGPILPVEDEPKQVRYALGSPFPNPFSSSVAFRYTIGDAGPVRINVYDLVEGDREIGLHTVCWDGRDGRSQAPSGVYTLVLESGTARESRTVTLVR